MTAILPCNDVVKSRAFYEKLGFAVTGDWGDYMILAHPCGAALHLNKAVEGWLIPGRNPFGLYFYIEDVDAVAAAVGAKAEDREWGMYEAAFSDPDETLVRVGWPSRLRG
jgi:predicted lactoylglutathione lyase